MKKIIIIIILFILSTFALGAQDYKTNGYDNIYARNALYRPNTLYFVYQPVDFGMGIRYDRMFNPKWGSYVALTYGKFKLPTGAVIDDHYKLVSGVLIYLVPTHRFYQTYLGVGVSYNSYQGLYNLPPDFPEVALGQWSFELSCHARLSNKFNIGVRVDPVKWETALDFGFSF